MTAQPEPNPPTPSWRRLAWFVGLWLGGLVVTAGVAYCIRWLMRL